RGAAAISVRTTAATASFFIRSPIPALSDRFNTADTNRSNAAHHQNGLVRRLINQCAATGVQSRAALWASAIWAADNLVPTDSLSFMTVLRASPGDNRAAARLSH